MSERNLSEDEQHQVDFAAEVFLDFMASAADGKDDDDLVFFEAEARALAEACGVELTEEIEPVTAGELRRRVRRGKQSLAEGSGP